MTHPDRLWPQPFSRADRKPRSGSFAARTAAAALGVAFGAALAAGAAHSEPAAPTATLDAGDSFVHYTGAGPIGINELDVDDTLFWFHESSGVYEGHAVESWYVFFDPAGRNRVGGTLTFATPIVTTFTTVNQIISTISFGDPDVIYNFASTTAGLEPGDRRHTVYSGGTMTFEWSESVNRDGDYMRVLTAAAPVPEPATGALAVAGMVVLGTAIRRRRRG